MTELQQKINARKSELDFSIKAIFTRCEKQANAGKRKIDKDDWKYPEKKHKKDFCEERHFGEYHMIIPKSNYRMSF